MAKRRIIGGMKELVATMGGLRHPLRNVLGSSRRQTERGFTLLELMLVVVMIIIITAISIPKVLTLQQSLEISGDWREISVLVAQAKVRGPANFTHARVYLNLTPNTAGMYTYHLDIWNKAGNGGAGCWQTDGDTVNSCTAATSPVQYLSPGVKPGYGAVSTPPANTEGTIGQAPLCYTGYAGESGNTTTVANTACIEFNSRGSPVDPSANGTSDANGAFYLTNGSSVYAVTVLASGMLQNWRTNANNVNWAQQ